MITLSASIEWIDRETYAYVVGDEKAHVWVDYELGLLSSGRIIHIDSIQSWVSNDGTPIRPVTEDERITISSAVVEHLQKENHPYRMER